MADGQGVEEWREFQKKSNAGLRKTKSQPFADQGSGGRLAVMIDRYDRTQDEEPSSLGKIIASPQSVDHCFRAKATLKTRANMETIKKSPFACPCEIAYRVLDGPIRFCVCRDSDERPRLVVTERLSSSDRHCHDDMHQRRPIITLASSSARSLPLLEKKQLGCFM